MLKDVSPFAVVPGGSGVECFETKIGEVVITRYTGDVDLLMPMKVTYKGEQVIMTCLNCTSNSLVKTMGVAYIGPDGYSRVIDDAIGNNCAGYDGYPGCIPGSQPQWTGCINQCHFTAGIYRNKRLKT